jgi:D-proline reductase (dithiol) PrdB
VAIIEDTDGWLRRFNDWKQRTGGSRTDDVGDGYPFVHNRRAPFNPARRALPMLNLALISSAGAYIDGTPEFAENDLRFREIPIEVESGDLHYAARGYNPAAVQQDMNAEVPVQRLLEFENNGIIGQLNPVFWSFSGFIPDATQVAEQLVPALLERINRYEVQAALLIPASRLCHQSVGLVARGLEQAGIPTMTLAVARDVIESVRAPRVAYYDGELGSVAGKPNWPEHQRRILDEALRWIEPMDQVGVRKLTVELESQIEKARGER